MSTTVPAGDTLRVVFFGTPDVAVPALETLHAAEDVEVVAVVTNPDRARGRSGTPRPSPVKAAALELGIAEILTPSPAGEVLADLERIRPDACAVVAYGSILSADVLAAGGAGFVNLHFSLLPRWRGAAPVQRALMAGDERTGVTCFVLDEGMDTGPVLREVATPVAAGETAGELLDRLADLGAPVLVEAVRALVAGEEPTPQADEGATHAAKISGDDAALDLTRPAREVVDLVRGVSPSPGAHTTRDGDRFKVYRARVHDGDDSGRPGELVATVADGPVVAVGEGAVVLVEVQPAGKARMDGGDFVNGYQPELGEVLGG